MTEKDETLEDIAEQTSTTSNVGERAPRRSSIKGIRSFIAGQGKKAHWQRQLRALRAHETRRHRP